MSDLPPIPGDDLPGGDVPAEPEFGEHGTELFRRSREVAELAARAREAGSPIFQPRRRPDLRPILNGQQVMLDFLEGRDLRLYAARGSDGRFHDVEDIYVDNGFVAPEDAPWDLDAGRLFDPDA